LSTKSTHNHLLSSCSLLQHQYSMDFEDLSFSFGDVEEDISSMTDHIDEVGINQLVSTC
jgi:hypothetical protein